MKFEKIGANLYEYLKKNFIKSVEFLDDNIEIFIKHNHFFLNQILYGFNLKSYRFTKYISQKKDENVNI